MKKQNPIFSNKIIFSLCVIIILFILVSTLPLPWNTPINNTLIDLQFKIRGSRQLSENIIVVFIGAEDIQALGGWQITRDYYWYVSYILDVLGAKVIGIDVLFDRANRNYPEYDAALADIFGSTKKVCLPMAFSELVRKTTPSNKFSNNFMEVENPT